MFESNGIAMSVNHHFIKVTKDGDFRLICYCDSYQDIFRQPSSITSLGFMRRRQYQFICSFTVKALFLDVLS